MQAITLESPGHLQMTERDRVLAGPGEVVIKIKRIGLCGTDYHAMEGNQPFFEYPRVLGHELAGEVAQLGEGVSGWSLGEIVSIRPYIECGRCIACRNGKPNCCANLRVLGVHVDGGMTEEIIVPADHLIRVEGLTLDQAVTIEFLSIGRHAVSRAAMRPHEWALVVGSGPVGLGVLKFSRLAGARTIAVDINPKRLEFAKSWASCDVLLDADQESLDDAVQTVTGGDRATVVFDVTGNPASMAQSIKYVANGGRLVYVGLAQTAISFWDPLFHQREMTLFSSRNALEEDFFIVRDAIRQGQVDTSQFITDRIAFNDAPVVLTGLKYEDSAIKRIIQCS